MSATRTFSISNSEVRAWIEQSSIHMKAVTAHGDPVELTTQEARRVAQALLELAVAIDAEDDGGA